MNISRNIHNLPWLTFQAGAEADDLAAALEYLQKMHQIEPVSRCNIRKGVHRYLPISKSNQLLEVIHFSKCFVKTPLP